MHTDACSNAFKPVVLQSLGRSLHIDPAKVYFTFSAGRLSYDCLKCGSKCCRGFGYSIGSGIEYEKQASMRKALPLFVAPAVSRGSSHIHISNVAPGCFFLANDGRCEVHTEPYE